MRSSARFLRGIVLGAILFGLAVAWADPPERQASAHGIPYKTESTMPEQQGWKAGIVLLVLLVAAGGVLYAVRKKMPMVAGLLGTTGRLRVVDMVRLDQRSRVYLIRLDGQEILIAQSGERLLQLVATDALPPSADARIPAQN